MKLTKQRLKEIIKEELESVNEDIGFKPDPDVGKNYMDYASEKRDTSGGIKMFMQKFQVLHYICKEVDIHFNYQLKIQIS